MLISPKVHFEDWISHSPLEVDLSAACTLLPLLIISLVAVMPVIVSFAINGYMYSKTLKTNMDTTILHKAFVCFFFLSLSLTLCILFPTPIVALPPMSSSCMVSLCTIASLGTFPHWLGNLTSSHDVQ